MIVALGRGKIQSYPYSNENSIRQFGIYIVLGCLAKMGVLSECDRLFPLSVDKEMFAAI